MYILRVLADHNNVSTFSYVCVTLNERAGGEMNVQRALNYGAKTFDERANVQ